MWRSLIVTIVLTLSPWSFSIFSVVINKTVNIVIIIILIIVNVTMTDSMITRFDHRNIVKLLGVCTRNEPVYMVMEFMLYGDLKT